jgi:hypothetical protein
MAEILLGDVPVLRARIALPRIGAWHAELLVDAEDPPTGGQTLATADGGLSLRGTVREFRSGAWQGRTEVTLVGGADGLQTPLTPRYYDDPTLRVVLADVCREAGETLSSSADAATLAGTLPKWTRDAGTAGLAIAHAAQRAGAAWRILGDGTLWVGPETWPNVEVPGDILAERPTDAARELATDTLYGLLVPGTTWDGRRVSYVEHHVDQVRSRTRVWFEPAAAPAAPADRIRAGLDALVRNVMRRSAFHALFPCVVLAQGSDGTLDLQPDAPELPPLTGVPLRHPSPGRTVGVARDARVLLAFEGGDPASPVALLFARDDGVAREVREHATQKVTLDAPAVAIGDNATRGIARRDDTVDRSAALTTWMGNVESALNSVGVPIAPLAGLTIGAISSASARGTCD